MTSNPPRVGRASAHRRLLHLSVAICLLFGTASSATVAAQEPAPKATEPARIALVTRFADGRATAELVSANAARTWTPTFPRITSPALNEQTTLPIFALQVARKLVGEDVNVEVSLLLRGADPQPVENTTIRRGESISIDALRQFGIAPIVLSVVDASPVVTTLPRLESVAPELVFEQTEIVTVPYPGHRITVRNVSDQAVAMIRLQTYRGGRDAMSRVNASDDGHPLIPPHARYQFVVAVSTGTVDAGTTLWVPDMDDTIAIKGVLWDDGGLVGDSRSLLSSRARVAGQRIQLGRIVTAYRTSLSTSVLDLEGLLRTVESLDTDDPSLLRAAREGLAMQRADARDTLRRYRAGAGVLRTPQVERDWASAMIGQYVEQLRRLSPP